MTSFLIVLSFPIFVISAQGQTCALPAPFDSGVVYKQIIHVSPSGNDESGDGAIEKPFRTLRRAARSASPGTEILLHAGKYSPGVYLENLQGTNIAPIRIRGESPDQPAVFSGGGEALHLTDPRYVILENILVEGASTNGINVDDGGSYDTPAEYVILRNVSVRHMNASGNNDGIKLSGLDHFLLESCTVEKPGAGGSAIDMVGCHDGVLAHNRILDVETSGVQAKGGCARLLLYANRFEHAGARAVNMGGSTGMQYFRPLNASAEASDITVWANVFLDSETPIAFVGCENGLFAHNTIYLPGKWAARILQENNDAQLIQCRNNAYINNIVFIDDKVNTAVNIGPNTHSNTFVFANNLWFHKTNSRYSGPNLPTPEINAVIQKNPLFIDNAAGDFHIAAQSPAVSQGKKLSKILDPLTIQIPDVGDADGQCWNSPPSIGAYEGNPSAALRDWKKME